MKEWQQFNTVIAAWVREKFQNGYEDLKVADKCWWCALCKANDCKLFRLISQTFKIHSITKELASMKLQWNEQQSWKEAEQEYLKTQMKIFHS